jgi:hypothetical protein
MHLICASPADVELGHIALCMFTSEDRSFILCPCPNGGRGLQNFAWTALQLKLERPWNPFNADCMAYIVSGQGLEGSRWFRVLRAERLFKLNISAQRTSTALWILDLSVRYRNVHLLL